MPDSGYTALLASLVVIAIACADSPPRDREGVADTNRGIAADTSRGGAAGTLRDTAWTVLTSEGATARLGADGTLTWRGRPFTPALPTRTADGTSSPVEYRMSPASPSGRWALVQGRGPTFANVYIVDSEQGTIRETPVTKYGITPWVAWSPAIPYAVVSNRLEGTALLSRVDLATGEARQIDFGTVVRSPLSATPTESTLRWLDAEGGSFSIDARVGCNDAVERCDGAPAAQTRTFRVDLRAMRVEGSG